MLDFRGITPVSGKVIAIFYLLSLLLISTMIIFVFPQDWFYVLPQATGYLINPNFLTSIFITFVTVYLYLIRLSPLDWKSLGLSNLRNRITIAVGSLVLIWFMMQVSAIIFSLATSQNLVLDKIWYEEGSLAVIGSFIGHLLGNAFFEELGYRAFVFPQIYLFIDRKANLSSKLNLVLSIFISQLLFSLLHLPIRIYDGDPLDLVSFLFLFMYGTFLVLVYLRTQNIFMAIVTHAFLNFTFPLIESHGFDTSSVFFVTILVIIILYPRIFSLEELQISSDKKPSA